MYKCRSVGGPREARISPKRGPPPPGPAQAPESPYFPRPVRGETRRDAREQPPANGPRRVVWRGWHGRINAPPSRNPAGGLNGGFGTVMQTSHAPKSNNPTAGKVRDNIAFVSSRTLHGLLRVVGTGRMEVLHLVCAELRTGCLIQCFAHAAGCMPSAYEIRQCCVLPVASRMCSRPHARCLLSVARCLLHAARCVAGCLLSAARCMPSAACRMLRGVCCLVACCPLHAVCCLFPLSVERCTLPVAGCLLLGICCVAFRLVFAVCCMKSGACCMLPVARCMSFAAYCPLHGAWCLDVVCCTLRGVGCIFAVCCMPSVVCCTGRLHAAPCVSSLHALRCMLHVLRCPPHGPMSHGVRCLLPVPRRLSSVARCVLRLVSCPLHLSRSHVACCLSSAACPIFHVACRPAAE
jgi:hypothetical protein